MVFSKLLQLHFSDKIKRRRNISRVAFKLLWTQMETMGSYNQVGAFSLNWVDDSIVFYLIIRFETQAKTKYLLVFMGESGLTFQWRFIISSASDLTVVCSYGNINLEMVFETKHPKTSIKRLVFISRTLMMFDLTWSCREIISVVFDYWLLKYNYCLVLVISRRYL